MHYQGQAQGHNNFKFKYSMYSGTYKIVEKEDVICLTLLQYKR